MQGVTDHFASPVDPERHRLLAGESRVQVLELLRAAGEPLGVAHIARQVGLHPNTVRLHLGQLVEAGLVTRERDGAGRPGRPRLVYAATPPPAPAPTPARTPSPEDAAPGEASQESRYQVLAEVLVTHLEQTAAQPAAEATIAGRAWGRSLNKRASAPASAEQAATDLTALMGELGFAAQPVPPNRTVELRRCPFRQVAEDHSPVVCGVHLGLMQGILEQSGAPMRVSGLEPFVTPGTCLAHFDDAEEPARS